jgi:hypothetical protein
MSQDTRTTTLDLNTEELLGFRLVAGFKLGTAGADAEASLVQALDRTFNRIGEMPMANSD